MSTRILLLSGPLAVGKSAVAAALTERFGFRKIASSGYLRQLANERGLPDTRESLQKLGDNLDEQTDYRWLVDEVAAPQLANYPNQVLWFVDAVRKDEQVRHFRARFPNILHVHLTAPEEVLRDRFLKRAREGDQVEVHGAYERFSEHPNEQSARALAQIADQLTDLSIYGADAAAEQIWKNMGAV